MKIFPSNTKIGDLICILFRCSVLAVLRSRGQEFQLVGKCFVYGIMDGEVLDRPHKEVDFNIKATRSACLGCRTGWN
jgi:hypothetical protein